MAVIRCSGFDYVASLAEIVGFKSGVALSLTRLRRILRQDGPGAYAWPKSLESEVRVRFEDFQDTVFKILFALGATDQRNPEEHAMGLLLRWSHDGDPHRRALTSDLMQIHWEVTKASALSRPGEPIDATPILEQMARRHGRDGFDIAKEFVDACIQLADASPWGPQRGVEWRDAVSLDELFQREHVAPEHAKYFDLRFTNYLHRNFEDIDKIHWRQFERLAAEFLSQAGFNVELGPGRNDDGIDVRASLDAPGGKMLTVLVQCKRQGDNVGRCVVKELWAEVEWAQRSNADTCGLVVTTSRLTSGARNLVATRGYPIAEADRPTVKEWIFALRSARYAIL